jgi:hypothetical protein
MVAIRINGSDADIQGGELPRFTDLIELVRSSIDPDHIITEILLDGKQLSDEDWQAPTTRFFNCTVDIATDTAESYVDARLREAPTVVQVSFIQFRDARKTFQKGQSQSGNQKLLRAVDTLRAFFEWYSTLLHLMPTERRNQFSIDNEVSQIIKSCNNICQQQLHQSWWALGQSIEQSLEPELEALEDKIRSLTERLNN